jgi:hypothetical protein
MTSSRGKIDKIEGFCVNCPYFATFSLGPDHQMQLCRKDPVSVTLVSADPRADFCSHHPLRRVHEFAGIALQGILSSEQDGLPEGVPGYQELAEEAYGLADAMIAEAAKRLGITDPDFIERQRENPE